jgi:rod shape-determining protein MreD
MDWLFACLAILLYSGGQWYVARMMGSPIEFVLMVPQILLALLAYPLIARIVLSLDRWRLSQ